MAVFTPDATSVGNTTTNISSNSTTLVVGSGEILIDSDTGSNIGDMTAGGGLAAAFDGNTVQLESDSANKASANSGYVGKTLAVASGISKAVVYAPYDTGYTTGRAVNFQLYGKTGGAPANSIDGTLLGEVDQVTDISNTNSQTIISNNVTVWNHTWVRSSPTTYNTTVRLAEVEFYEVGSSAVTITARGISGPSITANSLTAQAFTANTLISNILFANTLVANTIGVTTINANGSVGIAGQILTSNGSASYWSNQIAGYLSDSAADQTITGGARVTVLSLGNSGTGTITPDPGDRPQQKYTNNGAHTLAPGSNPGNYILDVLNTTGAGAITTSGWTKVSGDSFDTTTTSKFRCFCSVTSDFSLLAITKIV